MNPHFLALLIYLLSVTGSVALVGSFFFPKSLGKVFTQTLAKSVVAACRIAAAITTLFIVPLKSSESFLSWAIWAAPFSYLVWELTGIIAEHRSKATSVRVTVLEKNIHQLRTLLTLLGELIASKRTLIVRSIKASPSIQIISPLHLKNHLQKVRSTLDPTERIFELLKSLTSLLVYESQTAGRALPQNFRACLYVEEAGFMVEKASFDSRTQTTAGTRSSTLPDLRHRFQILNQIDPSVMVESVQKQSTIVISDCSAEHKARKKNKKQFYFNEAQKRYLKSLICYPFDLSHDPKKQQWAVLAVDTNVSGHFKSDTDGFFQTCLLEYSKRIDLELIYEELLGPSVDFGRRSP